MKKVFSLHHKYNCILNEKTISDSFQGEGEVFVDQIADEGGEKEDDLWIP
jgi:hypothetical protein